MSAAIQTKDRKVVISLFGFSNAASEYRELARNLVLNSSVRPSAELWAFESDLPFLREYSFPDLEKIVSFSAVSELIAKLQVIQLTQPTVLIPLGLSPIKTFALPTVGFLKPLEKTNLWAPLQVFESQQHWDEFANLVTAMDALVYCTSDSDSRRTASFVSFKDFATHMELGISSKFIECPTPLQYVTGSEMAELLGRGRRPATVWDPQSAPLVSVVTPSFNQAPFIRSTIDSVLNQSYPNVEYLVVDGGSTDGTVEILKSYGAKVKWISEKDKGYADALSKGFFQARGKYFSWLPSDDEFFDSESLSTLVSAIESNGANVVYGNCIFIDEQSKWLDQYKIEGFTVPRLKNWCLVPQPSTIFSAQSYRDVGGIDASLASVADYDLWLRIAENGGRFTRIGAAVSKYRLHPNSITTSKNASTYSEIIRLQKQRYGFAYPDWVRAGVGEIIHQIKGRPKPASAGDLLKRPPNKLRVVIRSYVIEPIIIKIPVFQTLLAFILKKIDS